MLKLGKYSSGILIFTKAFNDSAPVLGLLLCIFFVLTLLFGSLLFFAEMGVWYEPENMCLLPQGEVKCETFWPDGAYLRMDKVGEYHEMTPFSSIPQACWCVLTTITTVGYGDLVATSTPGKMLSGCAMVLGLVVVSLPITVISSSFMRHVTVENMNKLRKQRRVLRAYLRWLEQQLNRHSPNSYEHCEIWTMVNIVKRKLSILKARLEKAGMSVPALMNGGAGNLSPHNSFYRKTPSDDDTTSGHAVGRVVNVNTTGTTASSSAGTSATAGACPDMLLARVDALDASQALLLSRLDAQQAHNVAMGKAMDGLRKDLQVLLGNKTATRMMVGTGTARQQLELEAVGASGQQPEVWRSPQHKSQQGQPYSDASLVAQDDHAQRILV